MTTQILLQANNLIFIVPFALGLIYLGFYTLTGLSFGETDVDGHFAFDHDLDSHVDIDHDADFDHDVDGHDVEHGHPEGSAFLSALNWVGVGRMPLSLVLVILLLSWGTIGFCGNRLQREQAISRSFVVSAAGALVGSLLITHFVSSVAYRTVFSNQNIARRRHELLGSLGEALYPIDAKFGMVHGRDDRGELFQVACRVGDGEQPVAKGAAVQLVGYAAKERMFYVVPAESAQTPRQLPHKTPRRPQHA